MLPSGVVLVATVLYIAVLDEVRGHGGMIEPPMRAVMWRYGYETPVNYDWNALYCGGFHNFQQRGGKCGLCGDPVQGPYENDKGGVYDNGIIVRHYPVGLHEIEVKVELTAHHKGYFTFKLCPSNEMELTQACLDKYPLMIREGQAQGDPLRYRPPKNPKLTELHVILPPDVTCDRCVLQWTYTAGNSFGRGKDGTSCIGCGLQETFINCADISIGGTIDTIQVKRTHDKGTDDAVIVVSESHDVTQIIDNVAPNASLGDVLTQLAPSWTPQSAAGSQDSQPDNSWNQGRNGIVPDDPAIIPPQNIAPIAPIAEAPHDPISGQVFDATMLHMTDLSVNRPRNLAELILDRQRRLRGQNRGRGVPPTLVPPQFPPDDIPAPSLADDHHHVPRPRPSQASSRRNSLLGSIEALVGKIRRKHSRSNFPMAHNTIQALQDMRSRREFVARRRKDGIHRDTSAVSNSILGLDIFGNPSRDALNKHTARDPGYVKYGSSPMLEASQFQNMDTLRRTIPDDAIWRRRDGMVSHRNAVQYSDRLSSRDYTPHELREVVNISPNFSPYNHELDPHYRREGLLNRDSWYPRKSRRTRRMRRPRKPRLPRRIVVHNMDAAQHLLRKYPQLRGRVFLSRRAHLRNQYAHMTNKYSSRQRWH